jgi:hypothetical protein
LSAEFVLDARRPQSGAAHHKESGASERRLVAFVMTILAHRRRRPLAGGSSAAGFVIVSDGTGSVKEPVAPYSIERDLFGSLPATRPAARRLVVGWPGALRLARPGAN